MKLSVNRDDLLIALQDLVCSQVGKNMMVKSFEFIGKNDDKVFVKRIEVSFVKDES